MAAPFILPPLLLIAVLIVSAAFKLRDPVTSADAFASLRLPRWMRAGGVPRLLPYGELLLVLALVVTPAPVYLIVTIVALLLFLAYLGVIARALSFDEPVRCGCFGRLGLGDVDRRTVGRNALLVVLAVVAAADAAAGGSVIHRLVSFDLVQWTWLLGVAVATALTALIVSRPEPQPEDVGLGEDEALDYERKPIPFGALRTHDTGDAIPLLSLAATQPVLLVFLSLTCGSCVRTMEVLGGWAARHPLVRTVAVIAVAGSEVLPDLGDDVTWMDDPDGTVARTFGVGNPSAVLLGTDGLLAGGPETGPDGIAAFLEEISGQLAEVGIDPEPGSLHR